MAYDPQVINAFKKALKARGVTSPKVAKALFEAGLVESGLQNLNYGDRDSVGALQQRPSQGWKNASDPYKGALDFLDQAIPLAGKYGSSGQLAQAVQRSAYPGRYDQVSSEVAKLLGNNISSPGLSKPSPSTLVPGQNYQADRNSAVLQWYANRKMPGAAAQLATALEATPKDTADQVIPGATPSDGQPIGSSGTDTSIYKQRADIVNAAHPNYLWGGGHGAKPAKLGTPVDCSGAVSQILGINPRVSGEFAKWGKPGAANGKGITVYANGHHVLMEIDGHFFGTSGSNPGGGAGWIPRGQMSTDYLKNFTARHM